MAHKNHVSAMVQGFISDSSDLGDMLIGEAQSYLWSAYSNHRISEEDMLVM